jgi:RHS repeat-associated protein
VPFGSVCNCLTDGHETLLLIICQPVASCPPFTHDDDGNQTSNAHWSYTWDGENRLIAAEESLAILLQPPGSGPVKRQWVECAYDAQGRRIYKRVLTAEGMSTTFILKQSVVFLYDGCNMIAEIDTTTSARLIRSYEWGLDVSGTMDGAGGVGGLLVLRTHPSTINSQPSTGAHAPTYDGNGNVMELVNLATGGVSARYEYGAFGETISVDGGTVAEANPFRFSTKYLDCETGLLYYGYRYYNPETGRWLSRDPIEEQGGINLYGMVGNDPVNFWDYLGLLSLEDALQDGSTNIKELMELKLTEDEAVGIIRLFVGEDGVLPSSIPDSARRNATRARWQLLYNFKDKKTRDTFRVYDALMDLTLIVATLPVPSSRMAATAPVAASSNTVRFLMQGAPQKSIQQRLVLFYSDLKAAQAAKTADEALAQVRSLLERTEDLWSRVPKQSNPGLNTGGRMYAPREDFINRMPDGSILARSKKHKIEIDCNGTIRIKEGDALIFEKKGGGAN